MVRDGGPPPEPTEALRVTLGADGRALLVWATEDRGLGTATVTSSGRTEIGTLGSPLRAPLGPVALLLADGIARARLDRRPPLLLQRSVGRTPASRARGRARRSPRGRCRRSRSARPVAAPSVPPSRWSFRCAAARPAICARRCLDRPTTSSPRRSRGPAPPTCGSTRLRGHRPGAPGPDPDHAPVRPARRCNQRNGGSSGSACAACPRRRCRTSWTWPSAAVATTSWCAGARTSRRATAISLPTRPARATPSATATRSSPSRPARGRSFRVRAARRGTQALRAHRLPSSRSAGHPDQDDPRTVHRFVKELRGQRPYGPPANQRG